MSLGTKIYTWLKGNLVGSDDLGNKYYSSSKDFKDLKAKRWVIFNGEIEASNIPPHTGMLGFTNLLIIPQLTIHINTNGKKIINQI